MLLKNWNLYEKTWLLSFLVLGIITQYFQGDTWFNFFVLMSGILCVVLAAKGNILTYYFGLFNSICYAYLCYQNGLYGETGLNLFFFLPTGILGLVLWRKHTRHQQLFQSNSLSFSTLGWIAITSIISIVVLGYGLAHLPKQNTPYIDATTNILAIVATILMMLRYKEQWIFYILLNIFSILMWLIRTLEGSNDGMMMLLMWTAFLINAIYGLYNWHKMSIPTQHNHAK